MARQRVCILCGFTDLHVGWGLIEWRAPGDGDRFNHGPRCKDHDACRRRVHHNGEEWPVAENLPEEARR